MRVRFWGTRGSIAVPGQTTLRYGGNTSCVEVRADDGTLIILDCGTGLRELGGALLAGNSGSIHGHVLIGHTHWDHIQGFPFFAPLFIPGNSWDVYAPGGPQQQLEACLSGQMSYEYFPITLGAMNAAVKLTELTEGVFELGGVRVTSQFLNHPALTLGYRLEADGATVVYATDCEPYSLHPLDAPPGSKPIHHEDRRHIEFLEGADLIIHDAQYLLTDFPARGGWGHTPMERVVDDAVLADAKQLALFHHDPGRTDDQVDEICTQARARAKARGSSLEVFAAAEGQAVDVSGSRVFSFAPIEPSRSALRGIAPHGSHTVLVVDDDPDMLALLEMALQEEGVGVMTAQTAESALTLARATPPSLVILDRQLPDVEGLELCRTLRDQPDPRLKSMPVLVLTGTKMNEIDVAQAFVAGATDYLTKPIKPTLVRARVRSWLQRTG